METRQIYKNISPLDHRYSQSSPELFEALSKRLSEEASIYYCACCESSLLKVHLRHFFSQEDQNRFFPILESLASQVSPAEVYEEEAKTRHNIRALVNVIKRKVPPELSAYVHLGATSVDILDTATALKIRDTVKDVLVPLLKKNLMVLAQLSLKNSGTPQTGRTHGQWAVPLTFGYAVAEYVSRLGKSLREILRLSDDLRGKWSGAVGAYNALSMMSSDPRSLEKEYLDELGLKPSDHSTQLVEPEYVLRLLLEINVAFGILANLADDLRHLQRSEIQEVREFFAEDQVGSSTMPQKRNPWNCEHIKSLWKEFSPRVLTFFMDQISEHQRDLTNSASGRFIAEFLTGFALASSRMLSVLEGLFVDAERMMKTLLQSGDSVLAEAVYILLALEADAHAHETVRLVTLEMEKTKKSLVQVLQEHPDAWERLNNGLKRVGRGDAQEFFSSPEKYLGLAKERAIEISNEWMIWVESQGGQ